MLGFLVCQWPSLKDLEKYQQDPDHPKEFLKKGSQSPPDDMALWVPFYCFQFLEAHTACQPSVSTDVVIRMLPPPRVNVC